MNKWEESLTNSNDKRKILIESSEFVSKIKLSKDLKESLILQSGKAGTLIVKNIPVTILDRENLNGRIYSTETMRQAIEEAREAMRDKQTLGQANEHPESSFVAPTDASHVIINAYIKENIAIVVDGKKERHNVLFTDWEVLNTTHGKDLRALFEAECSFGTSIRGVGELNGKMVENYSFISVDGVGNPSSSTYTRMPVSESVKVEFKDANELKENYTVMSSSTNVVRDLSQAGVLQQQLNANPYGTVTKTSTKVDQETDPKTGAQTSITTVEADTEDEVSDLAQAFAMAQKAMTNGISKVNSVTIEANEDEDEHGNKTESVDPNTGMEAYVPESAPIEEDQITAQGQPEGIEFLKTLDEKGRYMFLGRMQADCKYFLDGGNYYNKFLWANSPEKQIEYMKWLYNSFPDDKKPEWISMEEIEDYERQMVGKGKEDHSRDENYAAESTVNEANEYTHDALDKKCQKISQTLYNVINSDGYTKEEKIKAKQMLDFYGKSLHNFDISNEELFSMFDKLEKDVEDKFIKPYVDKFKKITEAKEEKPKDPNEGKQYVLKIKDNDPEMKEDGDSAPEFVAMKGNAIRFTKDPKKALHFTQGMEESGVVHYSNIQKLLADMGYGEQNLEKWYKKDGEATPKKEGIAGSILGGAVGATVGHPFIGGAIGSLAQDALTDDKKDENVQKEGIAGSILGGVAGAAVGHPTIGSTIGSMAQNALTDNKKESEQLTEDGNTKYSLTLEIVNKSGLPDMKSLDLSSTDLESATKEVSNHYQQQLASNDVQNINKAIIVDNQTGEKFNYNKDSNQLVPENDNQVQQQAKPVEEPTEDIKLVDPEQADLSLAAESVDGEIEQKDNKLSMDIDDNTHVEKEFETPAQASVAKAAVEQGKVSGDIMLTDAAEYDFENDPKVYNQGRDEIDDGQEPDYERIANSVEYIAKKANCSLEDAMDIYSKVTGYSFDEDEKEELRDIAPGWYVAHDKIGISGPYETREACMEGLDGYEDQVSVYEVTESDLNEVLFKNPSKPSDDYVEKPLDEEKNHFKFYLPDYDFSSEQLKEIENIHDLYHDGKLNDNEGFDALEKIGIKNPIAGEMIMAWSKEVFDEIDELGSMLNDETEEESVVESSLVPVRFSNIKWDEKDAAYRMFEDIEKDMQVSHIEPDVNNANVLVEYFENYINDLGNKGILYKINPSDIKESVDYKEEIIRLYNEDSNRGYPKIESADISLA